MITLARCCATLLAVLLLAEFTVRLLPAPRMATNWLHDDVLGHRGPTDEMVSYLPGTKTPFNSLGYRGLDFTPKEINKDIFRVVILGDSITESMMIPFRRIYPVILENLLAEKINRKVEVVTIALTDYGTANQLLALYKYGKLLEPDVILWQFLGLNDFVNNNLVFAEKNKSKSDFVRPYLLPDRLKENHPAWYLMGPDGPAFTFVKPWKKRIRSSSKLFLWIELLLQTNWLQHRPGSVCDLESQVFLEANDDWQTAFEQTKQLATLGKKLADTLPSRPATYAFYAPSWFETDDRAWESLANSLKKNCPPSKIDRSQPRKKFEEAFSLSGWSLISLDPNWSQSTPPVSKLYLPDGHYSSQGQSLLAQILAQRLTTQSATVRPSP